MENNHSKFRLFALGIQKKIKTYNYVIYSEPY